MKTFLSDMANFELATSEQVFAERERSGDGLEICRQRLNRENALHSLSMCDMLPIEQQIVVIRDILNALINQKL